MGGSEVRRIDLCRTMLLMTVLRHLFLRRRAQREDLTLDGRSAEVECLRCSQRERLADYGLVRRPSSEIAGTKLLRTRLCFRAGIIVNNQILEVLKTARRPDRMSILCKLIYMFHESFDFGLSVNLSGHNPHHHEARSRLPGMQSLPI